MTASPQQNAPDPAHDAELRAAADTLASRPLTELFATDAGRAERFRVEAAGLLYSYAKQRVDDGALSVRQCREPCMAETSTGFSSGLWMCRCRAGDVSGAALCLRRCPTA